MKLFCFKFTLDLSTYFSKCVHFYAVFYDQIGYKLIIKYKEIVGNSVWGLQGNQLDVFCPIGLGQLRDIQFLCRYVHGGNEPINAKKIAQFGISVMKTTMQQSTKQW